MNPELCWALRIQTILAIRGLARERQRYRIIQCDDSAERDSWLDEITEAGIFSLDMLPMEGFFMRLHLEDRENLVARIWPPQGMPPVLYWGTSKA